MFKKLLIFLILLSSPVWAGGHYLIEISVPGAYLNLYHVENDTKDFIRSYPVVLGSAVYQTQPGRYQSSEIIFNPSWTPPVNSVWARNEKPRAPGKNNPLGPAALRLSEDVLVHGTPKGLGPNRYESHGCIRLNNQDAFELMVFLQNQIPSTPELADKSLYLNHPEETFMVALKEPVEVIIENKRITSDNETNIFYPNPYLPEPDMALHYLKDYLINVKKIPAIYLSKSKMIELAKEADLGPVRFTDEDVLKTPVALAKKIMRTLEMRTPANAQ